jgi:hypothetical protein
MTVLFDATTDEFKSTAKEQLHEGTVRVVFTKKDGTEREMLATLHDGSIPEEAKPKTEGGTTYSEDALRVFDVEVQEWRSFRWDSIKQFGVL